MSLFAHVTLTDVPSWIFILAAGFPWKCRRESQARVEDSAGVIPRRSLFSQ
jgi:hypothetical protein